MALQKWAAPAGSPLISTVTLTGSPGSQPDGGPSVTFGAAGDIAVGAVVRLSAHGVITTTGAPTMYLGVGAMGAEPTALNGTFTAPTGVTAQPWRIDLLVSYDGAAGRCRASVEGLTSADFFVSEVVNIATLSATWTVTIGWDANADDADSGDIIVIHGAVAEWIG